MWYNKIDSFFQYNEFTRIKNETTLYIRKQGNGDVFVVFLYVDDMIYFCFSKSLVDDFKSSMMRNFEMTDLGFLKYFLGLEVIQDEYGFLLLKRNMPRIFRKNFIWWIVKQQLHLWITMISCRVPMELRKWILFRSVVCGLNYLTHTRPDIVYSVSVVSRFCRVRQSNI